MKNKLVWVLIIYWGIGICNLGFGYNIYWANLHSHTSFSDGEGQVEEAYQYARDSALIDVLAITDHTHYLTENGYQYQRRVANQFTVPGQFVALVGQEFGSLSAFGHFSILEAEHLCPVSVYDLEHTYAWIAQNKLYAQFNHPRQGDFSYLAYNREGGKYVSTLEVVNGSGLYTAFYEDRYVEALNQGWRVAPVANQDNHRRRWGNATTAAGQIPLCGIWATELTKEKILEAIGNNHVYACEVKPANDRIYLRNFSIGSSIMGDFYYTLDKTVTIKLSVEAINKFAKLYLYKNGNLYDSVASIDTNKFSWTKFDTITNGYYFVKGVQQDGDRFWTAPIWVNYKPQPTGIEAWPNPIRQTGQIRFPAVDSAISSEMAIYTMEGEQVFKQEKDFPEVHTWNGTNQKGTRLDDGVYFVVIKVNTSNGNKIFKGKVALLR